MRANRFIRGRARALRTDATEAERALWRHLRRTQLAGLRFRRQAPLGRTILDFYCPSHRLAVELDGASHSDARDRARDAELTRMGVKVIHFDNNEVFGAIDSVLRRIREAALSQ